MQAKNAMSSVKKTSCCSNVESDTMSKLFEGITRVLSKWNGLQMAIEYEWGGHNSLQKSHQLVLDILSWFSQSKVLCVEDLENLLHESLLFSFNTEIEDGSIEEVAEQLMMVHDDCLHGSQL